MGMKKLPTTLLHWGAAALLAVCLSAAGCAWNQPFPVLRGEPLTCAGMTYRVLGTTWAHKLEVGGQTVVPTHNFLLVRVEVTNAGVADLPAMWLPQVWLIDEHKEVFPPSPLTERLEGGLRGSPDAWKPTETLTGTLVYDVPQVLYWLQPEGCPRLGLGNWWPERFGD